MAHGETGWGGPRTEPVEKKMNQVGEEIHMRGLPERREGTYTISRLSRVEELPFSDACIDLRNSRKRDAEGQFMELLEGSAVINYRGRRSSRKKEVRVCAPK